MTAVRRLIIAFLVSLTAAALLAQEAPVARTTEPVAAATDSDATNPRALRLSLSEAVNTSVTRNLGVEIQRVEYGIAGEKADLRIAVTVSAVRRAGCDASANQFFAVAAVNRVGPGAAAGPTTPDVPAPTTPPPDSIPQPATHHSPTET